jgi:hypothetical protein
MCATRLLVTCVAVVGLWGCGGGGTSPGSGTQTLSVDGQITQADANASYRVTVRRGNAAVNDALVTMQTDRGGTSLALDKDGTYRGTAVGWGGTYTVTVSSGADHLEGSIVAPQAAPITAPDPTVAFDPHTATGGVILLRWGGPLAENAHVRSGDFDWGPMTDPGQLTVPATIFKDTTQEVRVERENSTALAGGVAGSQLSADLETRTTLIVVHPFGG